MIILQSMNCRDIIMILWLSLMVGVFNIAIDEDLKRIAEVNSDRNVLLEEVNNRIKDLKDDYKENVNFLVGYDKQKYLNVMQFNSIEGSCLQCFIEPQKIV